jgi:hypothetical protein
MFDFTNCNIKIMIVHRVGNKTRSQNIFLSNSTIELNDFRLKEFIFNHLLKQFENLNQLYSFSFFDGEHLLNPLFNYSSEIFDEKESFINNSKNIARLLHEGSNHHQIKSGDLFIVYLENVKIQRKLVKCLGIFKSESNQYFLTLFKKSKNIEVEIKEGLDSNKIEKGCLIFNTLKNDGYRLSIFDRSGKIKKSNYWINNFLNVKSVKDNFAFTSDFLNMTNEFLNSSIALKLSIDKFKKIDILNRSIQYFKAKDSFEIKDYNNRILHEKSIIASFEDYIEEKKNNGDYNFKEEFEISEDAVRIKDKLFKRVLKLDSNFRIIIQGDQKNIEKGIDNNGRKFYKIYYEHEC